MESYLMDALIGAVVGAIISTVLTVVLTYLSFWVMEYPDSPTGQARMIQSFLFDESYTLLGNLEPGYAGLGQEAGS